MQISLLDLIVRAGAEGRTVIFSSHQVAQVERVAETVAIINDGKVVLSRELDEMRENIKEFEATFSGPPPAQVLIENPTAIIEGNSLRLRVDQNARDTERRLRSFGPSSFMVNNETVATL